MIKSNSLPPFASPRVFRRLVLISITTNAVRVASSALAAQMYAAQLSSQQQQNMYVLIPNRRKTIPFCLSCSPINNFRML